MCRIVQKMKIAPIVAKSSPLPSETDDEDIPLICRECDLIFTSVEYVHGHLLHHIKQPYIQLSRVQIPNPPLKITLKNRNGNNFEIINSPTSSVTSDSGFCGFRSSVSTLEDTKEGIEVIREEDICDPTSGSRESSKGPFADFEENEAAQGETATGRFSPNFVNSAYLEEEDDDLPLAALFAKNAEKQAIAEETSSNSERNLPPPPTPGRNSIKTEDESKASTTAGIIALPGGDNADYTNIPGAEPTPPPEPSPDHNYPKLKVKTTGLFKDPEPQRCTITEITDDNPSGSPSLGSNRGSGWSTPVSTDQDPLKLPDNDDSNLLSLFSNNERAKEFGMQSSDNEFISLDRFDERNRGAMQPYNSNNNMAVAPSNSSPLDSLTGLPMQALAQQVSRLQPSGNSGMHQQNVLINIQQFPSGPPQPQYQPPPMYPPHYPPQQPYQQPYQPYQPPHYYPPAHGYPPQPMGHPPPQMGQMQPPPPPQMNQQPQMGGQQQPNSMNQQPPQNQPMPGQMNQTPQQGGYRPPMPPRPNNPPRAQGPGGPRMGGPMGPRGPQPRGVPGGPRVRAPISRPRGPVPQNVRGGGQIRPRGPGPNQNGLRPGQHVSPAKRTPEQINSLQAKKKRMDVLTPDKDDDDCQVICMQPKNTDGGLPQIESVSGGNSDSVENSIMHLSDSITLKPIPPKPKPKPVPTGDAKAVANILAARGITVSSSKTKEQEHSPQKNNVPQMLGNGSVSIVAKNSHSPSTKSADTLPTVDLTDDLPFTNTNKGLPFRCDLCPAQYPNGVDLNKHRQSYHKTNGGMCELGVPLINIKQPGMMQRLAQLGIQNYIPLPSADANGMFALPIISTKNPGNISALGSTQMLSLGPIRNILKPQANNVVKQLNMNK